VATQFVLPCDACGHEFTIETSQAGNQLECPCGATVQVPSLMQIRRLGLTDAQPDVAPISRMSPAKKLRLMLVVAGAIVSAVAMLAFTSWTIRGKPDLAEAIYQRNRFTHGSMVVSQDFSPLSTEEINSMMITDEGLDLLTPTDTYSIWQYYQNTPISSYSLQARVENLDRGYQYWRIFYLVLAVAGIGVMACSLLVTEQKHGTGSTNSEGARWGKS
jgi:Trk-type K+ transport system membrane component